MVGGMGGVNPKISRHDVILVPNFRLHNQSFLPARSVYVRKISGDSKMSDPTTPRKEKLKRKKMKMSR